MMQKSELTLAIPYGTRDFLPREAAEKRAIESAIADTFAKWGYDEVVTPTIEFLDTLTIGNGSVVEPQMFKFFDKNNRTLALHHEMTTPIARLVASRLRDEVLPLKLSYVSSVYRYEQAQTGRQCEFYQAGVELIGSANASADAEIIALAIAGLRRAGLENFQISLGQVEFINGIMQQVGLTDKQKEDIKYSMEKRDLVGLGNVVDCVDLPKKSKDILKKIPLLNGTEAMIKEAYDMVVNEQSRRALDNLCEIYRLLKSYGVAGYVNFDLGVIRDFGYYTGMVFEAYTPGLGFPLCGGGRYDHMLSDFGSACPATGFALGIERIMLALEREGLPKPQIKKEVYVAYEEGNIVKALEKASALREIGKVVELALVAQTEKTARIYKETKGYEELVYIQ